MKKYIYITGIASTILMFLGCMFKVMHFPGAGILLTLSIFSLCILFLPFALHHAYHNSNPKRYGLIYIVTYIVFVTIFVGALFKVQHWPGASWFLIIGIPLPLVTFLPIYLIQTRKDKKYSIVNFMGIMFGMVFLTVYSALLALNVSSNIIMNFHSQLTYNQNLITNVYINSEVDNQNQVQQKSEDVCNLIEQFKNELLIASENKGKDLLKSNLNMLDNRDIPSAILFQSKNPGRLLELKNKLNSFKETVLSSENLNEELKEITEIMFDTDDQTNPNDSENSFSWEYYHFGGNNLIMALDKLTLIESNVKFVEYELLASN